MPSPDNGPLGLQCLTSLTSCFHSKGRCPSFPDCQCPQRSPKQQGDMTVRRTAFQPGCGNPACPGSLKSQRRGGYPPEGRSERFKFSWLTFWRSSLLSAPCTETQRVPRSLSPVSRQDAQCQGFSVTPLTDTMQLSSTQAIGLKLEK